MAEPAHPGRLLRELRTQQGLSQQHVAEQLGISRSTVANLEAGRHWMSDELLERVRERLPDWEQALTRGRMPKRAESSNPSLVIDDLTITYVFQESKSPSEIIQVRRVRAVRTGVKSYVLGVKRTDDQDLIVETHVLWGGHLEDGPTTDGTELSTVDFGRSLRRGEVHDFALRSWVQRDAAPDTEIWLEVSRPTKRASLHLAFEGRRSVQRAWTYELETEGATIPPADKCVGLSLGPDGQVSITFNSPVPGRIYALSWEW
jgi:transcriptional regulator with XRE-family HTH domain